MVSGFNKNLLVRLQLRPTVRTYCYICAKVKVNIRKPIILTTVWIKTWKRSHSYLSLYFDYWQLLAYCKKDFYCRTTNKYGPGRAWGWTCFYEFRLCSDVVSMFVLFCPSMFLYQVRWQMICENLRSLEYYFSFREKFILNKKLI